MNGLLRVWERVFGNGRGKKPAKSLKNRLLRMESLEDRALLSVTPALDGGMSALAALVSHADSYGPGFVQAAQYSSSPVQRVQQLLQNGQTEALLSQAPGADVSSEAGLNPALYFDLAKYSIYTNFKIDADAGAVSLYGQNALGTYELLASAVFSDAAPRDVTVQSDRIARTVTISEGALRNIDSMLYWGGSVKNDTVVIEGSEHSDSFIMSQQPSGMIIGDRQTGKTAVARGPYDTISVSLGGGQAQAVIALGQVRDVTINAAAGDDCFDFAGKFRARYTIAGADGKDVISFAEAPDGVKLNMGLTTRQATRLGNIRLVGDIEEFVGSNFNDIITAAANTTAVYGGNVNVGNTGADIVYVAGKEGTVTSVVLRGEGQKVVAKKAGQFSITIRDGKSSMVNVASLKDGVVTLDAISGEIRMVGTRTNDMIVALEPNPGPGLGVLLADYGYTSANVGATPLIQKINGKEINTYLARTDSIHGRYAVIGRGTAGSAIATAALQTTPDYINILGASYDSVTVQPYVWQWDITRLIDSSQVSSKLFEYQALLVTAEGQQESLSLTAANGVPVLIIASASGAYTVTANPQDLLSEGKVAVEYFTPRFAETYQVAGRIGRLPVTVPVKSGDDRGIYLSLVTDYDDYAEYAEYGLNRDNYLRWWRRQLAMDSLSAVSAWGAGQQGQILILNTAGAADIDLSVRDTKDLDTQGLDTQGLDTRVLYFRGFEVLTDSAHIYPGLVVGQGADFGTFARMRGWNSDWYTGVVLDTVVYSSSQHPYVTMASVADIPGANFEMIDILSVDDVHRQWVLTQGSGRTAKALELLSTGVSVEASQAASAPSKDAPMFIVGAKAGAVVGFVVPVTLSRRGFDIGVSGLSPYLAVSGLEQVSDGEQLVGTVYTVHDGSDRALPVFERWAGVAIDGTEFPLQCYSSDSSVEDSPVFIPKREKIISGSSAQYRLVLNQKPFSALVFYSNSDVGEITNLPPYLSGESLTVAQSAADEEQSSGHCGISIKSFLHREVDVKSAEQTVKVDGANIEQSSAILVLDGAILELGDLVLVPGGTILELAGILRPLTPMKPFAIFVESGLSPIVTLDSAGDAADIKVLDDATVGCVFPELLAYATVSSYPFGSLKPDQMVIISRIRPEDINDDQLGVSGGWNNVLASAPICLAASEPAYILSSQNNSRGFGVNNTGLAVYMAASDGLAGAKVNGGMVPAVIVGLPVIETQTSDVTCAVNIEPFVYRGEDIALTSSGRIADPEHLVKAHDYVDVIGTSGLAAVPFVSYLYGATITPMMYVPTETASVTAASSLPPAWVVSSGAPIYGAVLVPGQLAVVPVSSQMKGFGTDESPLLHVALHNVADILVSSSDKVTGIGAIVWGYDTHSSPLVSVTSSLSSSADEALVGEGTSKLIVSGVVSVATDYAGIACTVQAIYPITPSSPMNDNVFDTRYIAGNVGPATGKELARRVRAIDTEVRDIYVRGTEYVLGVRFVPDIKAPVIEAIHNPINKRVITEYECPVSEVTGTDVVGIFHRGLTRLALLDSPKVDDKPVVVVTGRDGAVLDTGAYSYHYFAEIACVSAWAPSALSSAQEQAEHCGVSLNGWLYADGLFVTHEVQPVAAGGTGGGLVYVIKRATIKQDAAGNADSKVADVMVIGCVFPELLARDTVSSSVSGSMVQDYSVSDLEIRPEYASISRLIGFGGLDHVLAGSVASVESPAIQSIIGVSWGARGANGVIEIANDSGASITDASIIDSWIIDILVSAGVNTPSGELPAEQGVSVTIVPQTPVLLEGSGYNVRPAIIQLELRDLLSVSSRLPGTLFAPLFVTTGMNPENEPLHTYEPSHPSEVWSRDVVSQSLGMIELEWALEPFTRRVKELSATRNQEEIPWASAEEQGVNLPAMSFADSLDERAELMEEAMTQIASAGNEYMLDPLTIHGKP